MQSAWVVSSAGSRTMDWLPEQPVLLKKTQGTLRGSNPGQHESRRATASSHTKTSSRNCSSSSPFVHASATPSPTASSGTVTFRGLTGIIVEESTRRGD